MLLLTKTQDLLHNKITIFPGTELPLIKISIGFCACLYIYSSYLNNFHGYAITYVNIIKMSGFIMLYLFPCTAEIYSMLLNLLGFIFLNFLK